MKSRRCASASALAENDLFRTPAIPVIRLGAKGGDLELLFVFDNNHHAEFASDGDGFREQFLDLFRSRVRGDVVILRLASEQKIAHAAADPERREARRLQAADNVWRQFRAVNAWWRSFTIYDMRFTGWTANRSRRCETADIIRAFTSRGYQLHPSPQIFLTCAMPAFDGFHRQSRVEFKHLDVLRFHERLERGKINHAGAGRGVVARGKLHVVNVKADQPRRRAIPDAPRAGSGRGFP